jgi:hypothetical protein
MSRHKRHKQNPQYRQDWQQGRQDSQQGRQDWQQGRGFTGRGRDEDYMQDNQERQWMQEFPRRAPGRDERMWAPSGGSDRGYDRNRGYADQYGDTQQYRGANTSDYTRSTWGQDPWERTQRTQRYENDFERGRFGDFDRERYDDGGYTGLPGGDGWRGRFELGDSQYRGYNQGMDTQEFMDGEFSGRGPRNYKRGDNRIEEDINERLTRHGALDASEIEVAVQNGEVTLKGSVRNRNAKRLAEDIAEAISGVKDVNNQIKVKQQGEMERETTSVAGSTKQQKSAEHATR